MPTMAWAPISLSATSLLHGIYIAHWPPVSKLTGHCFWCRQGSNKNVDLEHEQTVVLYILYFLEGPENVVSAHACASYVIICTLA